jgi:hypothetical protein
MTRTASTRAFAAIFAACLAGAFSASPLLAGAAAAALLLLALAQQSPRFSHAASGARFHRGAMLLASGTLNVATATAAAFALGRVISLLWIA